MDPYDVLGVSEDADDETLRRAYKKLAAQYHPDRNDIEEADARFKAVVEAYEILTNPSERARYNRRQRSQSADNGSQRSNHPGRAPVNPAEQRRQEQFFEMWMETMGGPSQRPSWFGRFVIGIGNITAIGITIFFSVRILMGMPLHPGLIEPQPVVSTVWIPILIGMGMICRPNFFEIPWLVCERQARFIGWLLLVICPLLAGAANDLNAAHHHQAIESSSCRKHRQHSMQIDKQQFRGVSC